MVLRGMLPDGCDYTPSDLWQRHPDIVVADLNGAEFPTGHWDFVTILGVIEYLDNPSWVLRTARERAARLILSCGLWPIVTSRSIRHPEERGQVNYFRKADLTSLLSRAGWTIERSVSVRRRRSWLMGERLFVCG